ncbi:MAG: hypothetical protein V1722_00880 [Candidatus Micrarchaeota archaeon]
MDSFLIPFLIFTIGILLAGQVIRVRIGIGPALALGFLLTILLPWLIFTEGIDLITIFAIILLGLLVARHTLRVEVLGSITLFVIAILVGGLLLQMFTGYSLAFR